MQAVAKSPVLSFILAQDLKSDRDTLMGHLDQARDYLPAVCAILDAWTTPEQLKGCPQKALIKLVRHARWVATDGLALNKRGGNILDSAIGLISCIVALSAQDRVSFHDAHAVCGGTQEGATQVKGVSRARLHKVLPDVVRRAAGTLSAQHSRTVGKNGVFGALGITSKSDAHGFAVVNRNHPMVIMTADVLNRLSDTTIVNILGNQE